MMTTWWQYLLLANLYLLLFYTFYLLLLRRETFFQLNRIYLVASALLSFTLPLIQSDWVKHWFITEQVQQTIYQANPAQLLNITAMPDNSLTLGELSGCLYLAGCIGMAIKLSLQLLALRRLLRQPQAGDAYSFFGIVQVDTSLPGHEVMNAHEQTHVRQGHSADRLLMELLLVMNWFNPAMYLYRTAIRHIHEFIADQRVISSGTPKGQYASVLFSQAFEAPVHQLTNPFFDKSLLKQRIIMLQKNKSNRIALVKYGLSAPLFAVMLVLSSATIGKSNTVSKINFKARQVMDAPASEVVDPVKTIATTAQRVSAYNKPIKQTGNAGPTADTTVKPKFTVQTGSNYTISDFTTKTVNVVYYTGSSNDTSNNHNEIFTAVENSPVPQDGMEGFYKFLAQNIRYPADAREARIQGRVIVTFIVEKDGSLSDVEAIRGPGYGMNAEAVRAVSLSPKWTPGRQNNRPVRVRFTVPIQFTLPDTKPSGAKTNKDVIVENLNGPNQPLYIVDGKETKDIKNIKPDDIESISVFKGKNATDKYGDKGADGVVVITTKKKQ